MSHIGNFRNIKNITPSSIGKNGQYIVFNSDTSTYTNQYQKWKYVYVNSSVYNQVNENEYILADSTNHDIHINLLQPSNDNYLSNVKILKISPDTNVIYVDACSGTYFSNGTTSQHIYKPNRSIDVIITNKTNYSYAIENDTRTSNKIIYVGQKDSAEVDFYDIKSAVDWVNTVNLYDCNIILAPGTYYLTDTVVISNDNTTSILSSGAGVCTIEPSTNMIGKPLFICESNTNFYGLNIYGYNVANYGLNASENAIMNINNDGGYCVIDNCDINTFYHGIVYDSSGFNPWLFNTYVSNCTSVGAYVKNGNFQCSETEFTNCLTSVYLQNSSNGDVNIQNSIFTQSTNQTGIKYDPLTYIYNTMLITPNIFKGDVSVNRILGFDFSTQRDSNIIINPNAGISNTSILGYCLITNNTIDTSIGTQSKKANGINNSKSKGIKMGVSNNRLTYYPTSNGFLKFNISGSIQTNVTNRVATISLVKNASYNDGLIAETDVRITTANQPFVFSINAADFNVKSNDFYEIWLKDSASTINYRLTELQFLAYE